jgi:hypothetical protein
VTLATPAGPVTLLGPSVEELRPLLLTAQVGGRETEGVGAEGCLQDKPTRCDGVLHRATRVFKTCCLDSSMCMRVWHRWEEGHLQDKRTSRQWC